MSRNSHAVSIVLVNSDDHMHTGKKNRSIAPKLWEKMPIYLPGNDKYPILAVWAPKSKWLVCVSGIKETKKVGTYQMIEKGYFAILKT